MTTASLKPLRPHQQLAIDGIRNSLLAGHRRPMLQAPTGAGKTVIAAHIVAGARAKGKRVIFVAPALGLIDQTFERFVENGIDAAEMGVIQADHPWRRPQAPIQIASVHTLARRPLPAADVVVIDEAHVDHKFVHGWMAMNDWLTVPFIGLSATPWTRGLGQRYDDLIRPTSTTALIEMGLLSRFRVYAPSHPDLDGVRMVAGDYHEGELGEAMSRATLVADVVTTWMTKGENRPTLCFAVNRAHAAKLADQFAAAGVPTAYIDANTPREERERIGRQLEAGTVKVVVNIGTLTTGIDWDVRCLILARPTKSEMLFVQIIGRALRTAIGKDHALILDHSDTHLRLGMVTDIDHDELDDGRPLDKSARKRKEKLQPLPRECKACTGLIPAAMSECPCCGAVNSRPTKVRVEDGELTEISRPGAVKPKSITDQVRDQGKRAVYAQLLWVCEEKGRQLGWAGHVYKDLYGLWPQGLSKTFAVEPTPLVRSWLKSRDIAFASRKLAATGAAHA
jgi:superfamily II DNA or RNA helicase